MNTIGMKVARVINLNNHHLVPRVLILIMDILMRNIGINLQIHINGEEHKQDQVLGNMVIMSTIGMKVARATSLKNQAVLQHQVPKVLILIMDIFMSNIGINLPILINGEENK